MGKQLYGAHPKRKRRIDITQAPYLAKGDGMALNTAAIQQAIEDCKEDEMVYIPAGTFLTGDLTLQDHMELYLGEGAVLQGSSNPEDYLPRIPSRFEGTERECYQSLLNLGVMDHRAGCTSGNDHTGARQRTPDPDMQCKNVRITGLTLQNGSGWNVHMIYSEQIVTDHCIFRSEDIWNGDDWDPDSSSDCTIFACTFYTGDDSVAIKSGKTRKEMRLDAPAPISGF